MSKGHRNNKQTASNGKPGGLQRHGIDSHACIMVVRAAVASRVLEEIRCSATSSASVGRVASMLCNVSFGSVGIALTASEKARSSTSFFTHASRSRDRQSFTSLASSKKKSPHAGKSSSSQANGENVQVTAAQPSEPKVSTRSATTKSLKYRARVSIVVMV